jgi:hypothetical protein
MEDVNKEFASAANKVFNTEDGKRFLVLWAKKMGINQSILAPTINGQSVKLTPDQQLQRAALFDLFHSVYQTLHVNIRKDIAADIF